MALKLQVAWAAWHIQVKKQAPRPATDNVAELSRSILLDMPGYRQHANSYPDLPRILSFLRHGNDIFWSGVGNGCTSTFQDDARGVCPGHRVMIRYVHLGSLIAGPQRADEEDPMGRYPLQGSPDDGIPVCGGPSSSECVCA